MIISPKLCKIKTIGKRSHEAKIQIYDIIKDLIIIFITDNTAMNIAPIKVIRPSFLYIYT